MEVQVKRNELFKPKQLHIQNPDLKQKVKDSFVKGKTKMKNVNHWIDGKGKPYQSRKFSQEEIRYAYESYLNESQTGSSSSMESNPLVRKMERSS